MFPEHMTSVKHHPEWTRPFSSPYEQRRLFRTLYLKPFPSKVDISHPSSASSIHHEIVIRLQAVKTRKRPLLSPLNAALAADGPVAAHSLTLPYTNITRSLDASPAVRIRVEVRLLLWCLMADVAGLEDRRFAYESWRRFVH